MRILLVTQHYPPFIGGAHRWAELLAHGLARRGHEVNVVTEWQRGLSGEEQVGAVTVHRVRQLRTPVPRLIRDGRQRYAPPFPDPLVVRDIRTVIAATRPEVALSHGWITFSAMVALARDRIPMLMSAHDYGYFCATQTLLNNGATCSGPAPLKCVRCAADFYGLPKGATTVAGVALSRQILRRRTAGVQTVSSFVDEVTWRNVFSEGDETRVRRYVIPAFLDDDPPSHVTTEGSVDSYLDQLPKEPFIMFVGALRRLKGLHILLDAYCMLKDRPPLVLMGTFEPDTPKRFPRGTIVLADVPHAAVMAAWKRAMFGVVPSVWPEPLGTVAIECVSQGTPVIISAPSGMVDVVGDDAGLIVKQGDVAGLADAMQMLADDPALRERLGSAGIGRAARFQAQVVLTEYERALGDLVADRSGAPLA